jgi:hypothetical protein
MLISPVLKKIPISVFGLTGQRLKPMIYCIQGEHANQNTTDSVLSSKKACTTI